MSKTVSIGDDVVRLRVKSITMSFFVCQVCPARPCRKWQRMVIAQLGDIHLGHDEEVGCVAAGRAPSRTAVCADIDFYLGAASLEDVVSPESAQCSDLVATRSRRGRVQIRYKRRPPATTTTSHQHLLPRSSAACGRRGVHVTTSGMQFVNYR